MLRCMSSRSVDAIAFRALRAGLHDVVSGSLHGAFTLSSMLQTFNRKQLDLLKALGEDDTQVPSGLIKLDPCSRSRATRSRRNCIIRTRIKDAHKSRHQCDAEAGYHFGMSKRAVFCSDVDHEIKGDGEARECEQEAEVVAVVADDLRLQAQRCRPVGDCCIGHENHGREPCRQEGVDADELQNHATNNANREGEAQQDLVPMTRGLRFHASAVLGYRVPFTSLPR